MKGRLVEGKWIEFDEEKITLEVGVGDEAQLIEYPLGMIITEDWAAEHLGAYVELVVINGKVKNIRIRSREF